MAEPDVKPTPPNPALPEKFAGKSVEDVVRMYTELESSVGKASQELGDLRKQAEAYSKIGSPDDITQALQVGTQLYEALQDGRLVAKDTKDKSSHEASAPPPSPEDFFDGYDLLSPQEQAKKQTQHVLNTIIPYIDKLAVAANAEISKSAEASRQERRLLTRVFEMKMKNPQLDIESVLKRATELAGATPDQLLDQALQGVTAPEEVNARVEERVAARLAELLNKPAPSAQLPDRTGYSLQRSILGDASTSNSPLLSSDGWERVQARMKELGINFGA